MLVKPKEVGKTADAGYQIGVRRTLPFSEQEVWHALLSPDGLATWLGGAKQLAEGTPYLLDNGTAGEVRVYKPGSHIRLTWQPKDWASPSALQIRVIPAANGTTISFHQDRLGSVAERNTMKAHWEEVILRLEKMLRIA